ncbi:MAG: twin-arginine translocase TatA/TatE family subunit [Rhodospirillaceae bacterium]|nr:twin-arginine translocase TatA/TatE family subunit [Rhodospirillaceae bacterium]MDE0704707.1 twin-arginine translocase TatA/TatE family subunit [Rhodospirillaceae bacterium]MYG53149.1 twin-arginine translocase TatA/TatE family subunit [Rhodospirillaceae bacterium]
MGLSIWQILIIVAVILLLFGGRKIPGLMRDLGSGITQFRKGLKADAESAAAAGDDAKVIDGKGGQTAGAKVDEVEKA